MATVNVGSDREGPAMTMRAWNGLTEFLTTDTTVVTYRNAKWRTQGINEHANTHRRRKEGASQYGIGVGTYVSDFAAILVTVGTP